MKYLRALQNTQIQGPNGPQFVKGPEMSFDDKLLSDGEVVEVPDNFVVNPQVFEPVRPGPLDPSGKPTYVPIERKGKPAAAGA